MAQRFHINPNTGKAGVCKADSSKAKSRGCDFAKDGVEPPHFASKEDATSHYEKTASEEFGATTTASKNKFVTFESFNNTSSKWETQEVVKPNKTIFNRARKQITKDMTVGEARAIEKARQRANDYYQKAASSKAKIAQVSARYKIGLKEDTVTIYTVDKDYYVTSSETFTMKELEDL